MARQPEQRNEMQDPRVDQTGGGTQTENTDGFEQRDQQQQRRPQDQQRQQQQREREPVEARGGRKQRNNRP